LASTFNTWIARKQLVIGEEVGRGRKDGGRLISELKTLITQSSVRINTKNVPQYCLPNRANFMFLSNSDTCFALAADDRRFAVHDAGTLAKVSTDLVSQCLPFVDSPDNRLYDPEYSAALYDHLLNVSLTGFDPFAPAPRTPGRAWMIDTNLNECERWLRRFVYDDSNTLLYSTNELVAVMKQDLSGNYGEAALAQALKSYGCKATKSSYWVVGEGTAKLWIVAPLSLPEDISGIEPERLARLKEIIVAAPRLAETTDTKEVRAAREHFRETARRGIFPC
jgi:hypothetical protein